MTTSPQSPSLIAVNLDGFKTRKTDEILVSRKAQEDCAAALESAKRVRFYANEMVAFLENGGAWTAKVMLDSPKGHIPELERVLKDRPEAMRSLKTAVLEG